MQTRNVNYEHFDLAELGWLIQKQPATNNERVKGDNCYSKGHLKGFYGLLWEKLRRGQIKDVYCRAFFCLWYRGGWRKPGHVSWSWTQNTIWIRTMNDHEHLQYFMLPYIPDLLGKRREEGWMWAQSINTTFCQLRKGSHPKIKSNTSNVLPLPGL